MIKTFTSVKQTISFAKRLAKGFTGGEILALEGEMGSGKTTFTKGIAMGLGLKDDVTSPTFSIQRSYEGGKLKLYHFDAYRLYGSEEAEDIGMDECLGAKDSVCVIEWPQKILPLLKSYNCIKIKFRNLGENKRQIEIEEQ